MNTQEIVHKHHLREVAEGVHGAVHVRVPREEFARIATTLVHDEHLPLTLLYATDDRTTGSGFGIHGVFACDATHEHLMVSTSLPEQDPRYESLTKTIMAAHWYERYAMDMFGIIAESHPDPRRLVHHENIPERTWPLRKDFAWNTKLAEANVPYPMHHVAGDGVYEIPVGPIHAGIIEPGHFRFNVAGERIMTLEGKLFFTHKGVEKLLEGKTVVDALPFIERLSGDMAAPHALAYCQAAEAIAGITVPPRARWLRTLVTELERMTMHVHDLANIAGNGTGYTVMAAHGFRVKELLVRCSESLLGNRFWRGFIVPGGVRRDLQPEEFHTIGTTVHRVHDEIRALVRMALASDGLRERLETTGVLTTNAAMAYGATGIAARASGVDRDARRDYPYAAYDVLTPKVVVETAGDVYARYLVRVRELDVTAALIARVVHEIPSGAHAVPCTPTDGTAIGIVESWRGEVCTMLRVVQGSVDRCFPRDPSFGNWALFSEIGPGNIVPDFPLCNKSLNLSYSGTDL